MSFSFAAANAPQQPQAAAPSSASTFGFGASNVGQSSSSLFATPAQTTTPAAPSFSFGALATQPPSAPAFAAPALSFGSSGQVASQPTSSFSFPSAPSFSFGTTPVATASAPPSMMLPQIASTPAPVPRDTKFEELAESVRTAMESVERRIREHHTALLRVAISTDLKPAAIGSVDSPPGSSGGLAGEGCHPLTDCDIENLRQLVQCQQARLRACRRRQARLWRWAELTAGELLACKATLADGRVIYRVAPRLDPIAATQRELPALLDDLSDQLRTLGRHARALRRQWHSFVAPGTSGPASSLAKGLPAEQEERKLKSLLQGHGNAVVGMQATAAKLLASVRAEKVQFRAFLEKYRHIYQDPFYEAS